MATRDVLVRLGPCEIPVAIGDDGRLVVAGAAAQAIEVAPGEWQVTIGGASHRLFAAGPADAPWIWHDGVAYRPEVVEPGRAVRIRHRDAAADLSAPMPATVRAIHVTPGDTVTRGQTLVVLEAMKMELPLKAPADGSVTSVDCRVGELVQPGAPLVVIS
jgi:biotin carboxyl carrier protein